VLVDYVSQYPNHKEEIMKKFIFIIVAFMLMLIFIGCFATMTPEQRKETYDMRASVGNSPFVGGESGLDARGMCQTIWF
jgi:cbb3-type cytochrome oxidase subunit 3